MQGTLALSRAEDRTAARQAEPDLEDLVEEAVGTLARLAEANALAVAWSSGKDSTACLVLALLAFRRLREQGRQPAAPLYVQHGDTEVESPAVSGLARSMLASLAAWAEAEGHDVRVRISSPHLAQSWAVSILSGQSLPTYPNHRFRKCSVDWKISPATRTNKAIAAELAGISDPPPPLITVLGTRYDESQSRARNMRSRGDDEATPQEHDGRLLLAPIARWSMDSVWELLGSAGTGPGLYPVWRKDFAEVVETYRDALSGECPVVAMAGKMGKSGCGARFGCSTCQAVGTDRSLQALAEGEKNMHLRRLLRNRDFVAALQGDYGRRTWVTRRLSRGGTGDMVMIQPDGFDSATLLDIAGAYILADREEAERARAFDADMRRNVDPDGYVRLRRESGQGPDLDYMERMRRPQFRFVTDRHAVGDDFYASVLRRHPRAFDLLDLYCRIWQEGHSPELPRVQPSPPGQAPTGRWLAIGGDGEEPGLGDPLSFALSSEQCYDEADLHEDAAGSYACRASPSFDVDPEAASLVVSLLYPDDWRRSHREAGASPTRAVQAYLSLGAVSLSGQGRQRLHRIMKVRQRIERQGLYDMPTERLLRMCLPDGAPARGARQEELSL